MWWQSINSASYPSRAGNFPASRNSYQFHESVLQTSDGTDKFGQQICALAKTKILNRENASTKAKNK
jgi:hypothetical protein